MNTTTARELLNRTARNALRHMLVLGALVVVALFSMAGGDKPVADRPAAPGSAAAIVAQHGCSDTVAEPTHVVVTTAAGVTRYAGQRLTDQAIEQAVFGMDHGLIVHGFCA